MAGTKEIKRRIKSVKNTKKITKAMELVAASKMKRAVASTLASRLYAEYSWDILISIAESVKELNHPLFNERKNVDVGRLQKVLLILITSNRGLCGAYNAQVIKKAVSLLKNRALDSVESLKLSLDAITIGRKGDVAVRRLGVNVVASFTELSDHISLSEIVPISKLAIDEYSALKYDKVLVAYTDFVSALTQRANVKQILPVSRAESRELIEDLAVKPPLGGLTAKLTKTDYLFEGDKEKLISSLAEKLTRMQIYQMLLESNASEQSSRMVAMKNASDASGEMIDDLTLMFNKARQSNITREISEISAGMASVS
ncbi:ATP synthase F1 subunit gamma [Candidatus Nomurabacteria bacterium RIFCSPLOWO2_01_FULL_40_18]|uniref:ATP synthase gamma chain n=1 Tax=Candidatus Nomurabacteria bacterium RIFCSPLOWO2_01_FULL_40_18 TaxID=1801773 RepID=A0A1F6XKL4_9BACT|nr:MAG: ATP synthase F1 subunit gamma [Candidatus Nomurabacteria bacterium RIFCSPLOWO2_01_FULL_40_18]